MDRRDFTRSLLGGAAALALPAFGAGAPAWTLGYEGTGVDAAPMPLTLEGRWPDGLRGSFYRNGPARHTLGAFRYHHWFDGDGLVQRYAIGPQGVEHRARFVRTPKFAADSAAGRPMSDGFGTHVPGVPPPGSPDALNVANTSVLPWDGELLALWEGGSAYRLDAQTLETRGAKTWSPETAGLPFSAHPRIEPDGSAWNFGVAPTQGRLVVYRLGRDGALQRAAALPLPSAPMVHDFAVTERHLVFLLPPLVFEHEHFAAGASFLDSHVWRPGLGLRVLVLPKDRLDAPRHFELPAGFVFHLGNAWEDGDTIRLDCMQSPDAWHANTALKQVMEGRHTPHAYARLTFVELDLASGRARQTVAAPVAEFPRVDPAVVGRRYRQLFMAERADPGDRPGYDALLRLDVETGATDRYRFGRGVMVEEHLFVPRPGATREGDGWLVGTSLDLERRRTRLHVFDATNLAAGPLALASMARVMPLGLHGAFVAA